MTTHDPATRHGCEHCAEGVPLNPDGLMHTHTGSDGWHAKGHESPCFSDEAYELVHARNERSGDTLARVVDHALEVAPIVFRAARRVNEPFRNAGYFADTPSRRRGRP